MQERPHAMTEIDIASDQEHAERGGTAATDLQLESWNLSREPCRHYTTVKVRLQPVKLTDKVCRSPHYTDLQ